MITTAHDRSSTIPQPVPWIIQGIIFHKLSPCCLCLRDYTCPSTRRSTLDHPKYLIFDSYDGAGTISDEPDRKVSFFGLSVVFNILIFMKILILISLSKFVHRHHCLGSSLRAHPEATHLCHRSSQIHYLLVSISFPLDFSFHMLMIPQ